MESSTIFLRDVFMRKVMTDNRKMYPVDAKGNMMTYEHWYGNEITWLPMEPFIAELSFIDTEKGRSSFRFNLGDPATGKVWSLMYNSVEEFVKNSVSGRLLAQWDIVKRGANWGIVIKEVL